MYSEFCSTYDTNCDSCLELDDIKKWDEENIDCYPSPFDIFNDGYCPEENC